MPLAGCAAGAAAIVVLALAAAGPRAALAGRLVAPGGAAPRPLASAGAETAPGNEGPFWNLMCSVNEDGTGFCDAPPAPAGPTQAALSVRFAWEQLRPSPSTYTVWTATYALKAGGGMKVIRGSRAPADPKAATPCWRLTFEIAPRAASVQDDNRAPRAPTAPWTGTSCTLNDDGSAECAKLPSPPTGGSSSTPMFAMVMTITPPSPPIPSRAPASADAAGTSNPEWRATCDMMTDGSMVCTPSDTGAGATAWEAVWLLQV